MTSGPDQHLTPDDKQLEDRIKRPDLVYPVPFSVFWKEVRGKIDERKKSGLFEWLRAPATRAFVYAGASLAVMIVLLFSIQFYFRNTATVTLLRGTAEVKTPFDGKWRRAHLGERLPGGTQVRSGSGGEFEMRVGKDSLVRLGENGKLTLKSVSRDFGTTPVIVSIEQGSAFFKPNPGKTAKSFQVFTSFVKVTAGENRFSVTVTRDGNTKVAAVEGPVLLEPILPASRKGTQGSTTLQDLQQAVMKKHMKPFLVSKGSTAEISKSVIEGIDGSLERAADRLAGTENPDIIVLNFNKEISGYAPVVRTGKVTREDSDLAGQLDISGDLADLGRNAKTEFISDPYNALVTVNDRPLGSTPFSALITKNVPLTVTVFKKGFTPSATNITLTNDSVVKVFLSRSPARNGFEITDGRSFPENLETFENVPSGILEKPFLIDDSAIFSSDGNTLKIYANKILVKTVVLSRDNIALGKPLYFNGRIYVGSDNGGLYIYSQMDDVLKVVREAGRIRPSLYPFIAGNRIVLPTQDKGLEFYSDDGELVRRVPPDQNGSLSAIPYYNARKDTLVLITAENQLVAYGSSMEKTAWSTNLGPVGVGVVDPLAGNDDYVFLCNRSNATVSAFRLNGGKPVWTKSLPEFFRSELKLSADKGRLYVTAWSGLRTWFITLNASTGNLEFRKDFPGQLLSPITVEGKVVLMSRKGKTALYDPFDREIEYSSILK